MLVIGHRGAKGLAPENTIASLHAGLDNHAVILEIDVRVTADGIAIVHHDVKLRADDGRRLAINKSTLADLQSAKADLLSLEAALQFIGRRADVIIEIKPGQPIQPVADCVFPRIIKHKLKSDIILASKDFKVLRQLHETFPELPIAVIERWSGVRAAYRARSLGTKLLVMNQRWLWSGFIKRMSKQGYKLSAYTMNDPVKAKRWAGYGLYGAITDYPDRFTNT